MRLPTHQGKGEEGKEWAWAWPGMWAWPGIWGVGLGVAWSLGCGSGRGPGAMGVAWSLGLGLGVAWGLGLGLAVAWGLGCGLGRWPCTRVCCEPWLSISVSWGT